MFQPVEQSVSFPKLEESILAFWKQQKIYEKSLAAREGAEPFVFYEGPPTANGLPHPGHCLTRAIKDLFPRYKTMRGFHCPRKGGWDTHGLPVEVEVSKELGIHSKEEIEQFGVEPFIHRCIESVFRYTRQWEDLTERLGFWIHLDEAYVTYHQSYVESVWWALKNFFERGLLYQGHKIVWWWAQGGTALSSGEVGQGYREVADPSVYVRFPLVDPGEQGHPELEGADLLVWTTTPWTLPSNQFAAVRPDLEYVVVSLSSPAGSDGSARLDKPAVVPETSTGETPVAPEGRRLLMAAELVDTIAAKAKLDLTVEKKFHGEELIGLRYRPPFSFYYDRDGERAGTLTDGGAQHVAWRIVAAEFVTVDTGTGIVHQAPAFGEVDYEVLIAEQQRFEPGEGPELICSVGPDGTFTKETPNCQGRWVKDCDREITRELRDRGLLFHQEQYIHDYPFCWRAEQDALIQYPRQSWFVRTTAFKDRMLENNRLIGWLPEHIRDGRFGNFLETNVDWALSRERYWGTPLPIWVCEKTGHQEAIGSYDELLAKPDVQGTEAWEEAKRANPELPEHLKVHKPYIDAVTYQSPKDPTARMRRVTEVIDCWFDSGSMPFAQWGYPGRPGSREQFERQFPADFISEALDQTRGWFYSLLAISTLLFSDDAESDPDPATRLVDYPHPYRNCIVLGLMLGEDGGKMSKSKRNYREPSEIFNRYGADALRWYFFSNQPPWTSIRYSEQAIREAIPEFLLTLWNCYSFFVIYANIDGFDPAAELPADAGQLTADVLARAESYRPVAERHQLDRWMISELHSTAQAVVERMDVYDNFGACAKLNAFADGLSNWFVRRSRERFWSPDDTQQKRDAYWTLYECLVTASKLVAPFVPFLAEAIWGNLARAAFGERVAESVHLCDYPEGDATLIDEILAEKMALAREISSLGRSARMNAKLKVRQPLARVEVILADDTHKAELQRYAAVIAEELNVKQVEVIDHGEQYITYTVLPDLKRLGPRLGKRLPAVRKLLGEADGAALLAEMQSAGKISLDVDGETVELDEQDIQVRLQAKEGWAAAQGPNCVVVLSTELTPELIAEGHARELVRAIQDRRKEMQLDYTDRIRVGLVLPDGPLAEAATSFENYVKGETLATELGLGPLKDVEPVEAKAAGERVELYVAKDSSGATQ